jgi:hypothetical protein
MNTAVSHKRRNTTRAVLAGLGAIFGLGAGYVVGRLLKAGALRTENLGWSDIGAVGIAVCLIGAAVMIIAVSLNARAAGRMVDPDGDRPATPAQKSFYRQQAMAMFLAGAMLATPVAAIAAWGPLSTTLASIVMLGIIAAFLLQTFYNLTVWRRGDELMRQLMSESGAVCFWVLQGLLFLWACAEKLDLAPHLSAWDLMTILMGFYLVISSVMSVRRGFS